MSALKTPAALLRCFTPQRDTLSVTEAAALLGIPKSTASRLLRTMQDAGFLSIVGRSKRYRPGPLLFEIVHRFRSGSSLIARADRLAARIARATGHSSVVTIRDGTNIIGLINHEGHNVVRVSTAQFNPMPAFASASGRALLARLSDGEIRAIVGDPLEPPNPAAPQSLDELFRRIALVRRLGHAEGHNESNPGVGALAVAVCEPQYGEAVSLCVAYPLASVSADERKAIVSKLLQAAKDLAHETGDPFYLKEYAA